MVVTARDPITKTTLLNPNNLSGSLVTMLGVLFGITLLLFLVGMAQNRVLPTLNNVVGGLTGGVVQSEGPSFVDF